MTKKAYWFSVIILISSVFLLITCSNNNPSSYEQNPDEVNNERDLDSIKIDSSAIEMKIVTAAEQLDLYLPLLKGKKVGVVANHTSYIGNVHLIDTLIKKGVEVIQIFAPEHGFRGDHDAGAVIDHGKDAKTGLPVFSLHGKTKKPTEESLIDIDVIVFDIQDVGVRFYTYISTLHYVMEAAAENNKKVIVLDRPNPNAFYIAGPILQPQFKSFVGMHPVPVVYGMTIGEYAKMINGEEWLENKVKADLTIIPLKNWNHKKEYVLPIPPSPNLPNQQSIYLYPSLCFFEGTELSVGRGTNFPFQVYGHPKYQTDSDTFIFTPISIPGKSKYPKFENEQCYGVDLRSVNEAKFEYAGFYLKYLNDAIANVKVSKSFIDRPKFFNLLFGTDTVYKHIMKYGEVGEIENSWEKELEEFKKVRQKYLMY